MKKTVLASLGVLLTLGICLVAIPPFRYWVLNNVGRYHIVLLHFPIGLLLMAFLMETTRFLGLKKLSEDAIQFVLGIGTIAAIFAASTGWVLQFEGGYDADLLEWHERLGIFTALLAILTFGLHRFKKEKLYRISLVLTSIMVTVAGHIGGSLTHGEGFLTEQLSNTSPRENQEGSATDYKQAQVFPDLIHPILTAKCVSCHNSNKRKGGLTLVDSTGILAGGEHGQILSPGSNGESEMVHVINVALEDEEHMPPKGKAQLSAEEIGLITWWVDNGAPFSKLIAEVPQDKVIAESIRKRFTPVHPIDRLGISSPDPQTLTDLQTAGFRISRPDPIKPWLTVNLSDAKELTVDRLEELDAIQDQITELDLGNTALTPDHLAWVNDLDHLLHLKLDNSDLTANSLSELSNLSYLEVLNVYRTDLKGLSEAPASNFPKLKKLFSWESGIPASTLEAWKTQQPQIEIFSRNPDDIFPRQAIISPKYSVGSPFFSQELPLALSCEYPNVSIHYTLDGSPPGPDSPIYKDTLLFKKTTSVKAQAYLEGWDPSPVISQTFVQTQPVSSYKLKKAPDEKYPGQPQGLVDQQTGEAQFGDKQWAGFWGRDCNISLELSQADTVKGIAIHALEEVNSWVLFPQKITVKAGPTPSTMKSLATKSFDLTQEDLKAKTKLLNVEIPPTYARYIKIEIVNYGKLPVWHASAGQDAWLFLDEIGVY